MHNNIVLLAPCGCGALLGAPPPTKTAAAVLPLLLLLLLPVLGFCSPPVLWDESQCESIQACLVGRAACLFAVL